MQSYDKEHSRQVRVAIRHVLLDVWDPIGVREEPFAQDEYDGYLGDLYALLLRKANEVEVEEYLNWVQFERMGRNKSIAVSNRTRRAVSALRAISLIKPSQE